MDFEFVLNFSFVGLPAPGETLHNYLERIKTTGIKSNLLL